jgi:DNA helicase-2/ATP-dependent DNA helicase PcrA
MKEWLLNELNEGQRQAVEYCDGPQLVIAGAGSGKTRVLTYKIAYLLEEYPYMPWNILALTFTNKAAREMKERIGRLVGQERAQQLQMGTFHSVFARILRAEAEAIGFAPNYTIYDQADSRSLVKSIIKEMQLDDKTYKPNSVADRISMAKNHLLLPSQYEVSAWAKDDAQYKRPLVSQIYQRYTERCRQANAMDFDDLLVQTWVLFRNHEDIRQKYANRFQYVLVDEYQDTNFAQQEIVLQLTREHQRVCVVGDDAQSIYSFRGANIDNILDFQKKYDGARLFKLEQNYRSTQLIVQAANSLIRKNARQIHKDVFSENEEGERLMLKPAYSDKEEAMIVCNDIRRIRRQEGCQYSDFAILYRTNAQSRSFEEQMRKDGIPYRIYGGLSFYQRKEIKDVIAYFRVVANPNDEEALRRIINYPARGIGDTTIGKIVSTASMHNVSLWQVIQQPIVFDLQLSKGTLTKLDAFKTLVEGWAARMDKEDAYELGHSIIMESGVSKEIYGGTNPEDLSRQENLEEFLGGMQDFVESRREEGREDETGLSDFLQEVALLTDLDSDDGKANQNESDNQNDKVTLMTIHAAKGLEFPTVFIVGLEENIFPSPMCVNSMRELEEERRLLYVAITRAERHCILTCAQNRFRYGRMEFDTPSRFIKDIDPRLLRVDGGSGGVSGYSGASMASGFSRDSRASGFSRDSRASGFSRDSRVSGYSKASVQNPRPVATQFVADVKPRMVPLRHETPRPQSAIGNIGLKEGNVIEHQRFGIGTVIKIEGVGENTKATVTFKNAGTKQLLLKFAKYTIIG